MKQRDAVYQAVVNVCGQQDVYEPTKEERAQVAVILFEGFRSGSIELAKEFDDAKLKAYIPGLVSNWLRKDNRLNGNVKYEAKNPGSRAGSSDAQIKAMRLLLSTKTDDSDRAEIQEHIDRRLAEIKPSASKTLTPEQIAVLKAAGLEHLVG